MKITLILLTTPGAFLGFEKEPDVIIMNLTYKNHVNSIYYFFDTKNREYKFEGIGEKASLKHNILSEDYKEKQYKVTYKRWADKEQVLLIIVDLELIQD